MDDQGLFGEGSVTWRVHVELVMWIAGVRAMYLQALHPRVMRGTFQNSALFDDKKAWARFLRTANYVHIRTYGTTAEVDKSAARVRAIHAALTGFDPDSGTTFRLDDPENLLWVHCSEIDSYVDVARRCGVVDDAEADQYVWESRRAAEVVGIDINEVPGSRAELREFFDRVRPGIYACDEARRSILKSFVPPLPTRLMALRLGVPAVNMLAIGTLPSWAKRMFQIPVVPGAELATTVQLRAVRTATNLARSATTAELIAEARQAAREMSAGTFTSILAAR